MPNLPMTVPRELYDEMLKGCGEPFADSYLSGAELHQNILLPRTHKAWERITENWAAKDVLRFLKITLREPPYFNAAHNVQLARAA
jgi:hypothetical protein